MTGAEPSDGFRRVMIRAFLFCLATVGVFINIEGRDAALARPIELAVGRISVPGLVEPVGDRRGHRRHENLLPRRDHYYGAERPDGYYGYGYYQPYHLMHTHDRKNDGEPIELLCFL